MENDKIDINKLLRDIEFQSSFMDDCDHEPYTRSREGLNLYRNIINLITYIESLENRIEKLENKLVSQDMHGNGWYDCIKDYSNYESNKYSVIFTKGCTYQVTDQDEYYVYILDAKNNEHALFYDEMKEHFKI